MILTIASRILNVSSESYFLLNYKLFSFRFELDLTITMKPSSNSDSIVINPSTEKQVENIQVRTGVKKVQSSVAFMLALDQERLGSINLGSMLHADKILPCLLSASHGVELTGMKVDVNDILTPTITGFVSKGIDRILKTSSKAIFDMYEASLLKAIPNFFQMTVRKMLNEIVVAYMSDTKNVHCTPAQKLNALVDFRDFFMPPDDAKAAGASGAAPYGDIGPMAMDMVNSQLLSLDEKGSLKVNSIAIQPMTKVQSGTAGMLQFPSDIFSLVKDDIAHAFWSAFAQRMELRAYNTRIKNLDTIREPISLLLPSPDDPQLLQNNFNIGKSSHWLSGSVRVLLDIAGGGSPLWMRNEIDIGISVASTGLIADTLVYVSERRLMELPLRDVTKGKCWLATIPAPLIDEYGFRVDERKYNSGLLFSDLGLFLDSLQLYASCISCTSSGLLKVPQVMQHLDDLGAITSFKDRLVNFAVSLFEGQWMQSKIDRILIDAPKKCPHDPAYDENFKTTEYADMSLPPLTRDALELFIYTASLLLQIGVVAGAESHVGFTTDPRDPLYAQMSMEIPAGIELLNLADMGDWTVSAMEDIKGSLGAVVEDPDGPNGKDLNINVLLRSKLLNEDRALNIPVDRSIEVGEVMIGLDSIRILGLDTLNQFDTLNVIGNQTLSNYFSWDSLDLELDISIDMNPSTSLLSGRKMASEGVEQMTFGFSILGIDATLASLLAIDLELLGGLQLGSILHSENILPCLLSAMHTIDLTQLAITAEDITHPTLNGFISEDVGEDISASFQMIFSKYKSLILDAIPPFFDMTVRVLANNVLNSFVRDEQEKACPSPALSSISPKPIDLRDLLLQKDEAKLSGASGNQPYGDLPSLILSIVDEQFLSAKSDDGHPKLNDVVRTLTLKQSGSEGYLNFGGDIVRIDIEDTFEFCAYDVNLGNLDTIGYPLELMKPRPDSPYHIDNVATVSVGPEALRGSLNFFLAIKGDPVIQMKNDLVLAFEMGTSEVLTAILAKVNEKSFVHFPLQDILNPQCWLATIPPRLREGTSLQVDNGEPNLALDDFALSLAPLRFNISCVSCSTLGLSEFPQVLEILDQIGIISEWTNMMVDFATELIEGDLVQVQIDQLLSDAPKQCPHNAAYEESFVPVEYDSVNFPNLSRPSVEFIFFSVALSMPLILVVGSKSHLSYEDEIRDPLSRQKSLQVPTDMKLLDFSDLGASIGNWADTVLNEIRGYLSGTVENPISATGKDLKINVFLRSALLDKDKALTIPVSQSIEEGGIKIGLQAVKIFGLDSFTSFNALDVIGSQTLLNKFSMKYLRFEVQLSIGMDTSSNDINETMTFEFSLDDIHSTVGLLLAMNIDHFGALQLGSFLHTMNIPSCLLSAMYDVSLTQVSVSVGDIHKPTINGFLSPELIDTISNATDEIFSKYKPMMMEAIPRFFDVTVRTLLNNLLDEYTNKETSVACQSLLSLQNSSVVDFRDLLLPESDALRIGGSGESPYGDLFRSLKSLINEQVMAVDSVTGLSKVNDMIIAPLTKQQSKKPGVLHYPDNVFGAKKNIEVGGFKANVELQVSNIRIENLDTLNGLEMFQPIRNQRSVLNNTATMGVKEEPLGLTITILTSVQGDGKCLFSFEYTLFDFFLVLRNIFRPHPFSIRQHANAKRI